YEALLYVWGSLAGNHNITCDGKLIIVTSNCFSALRHLRRRGKPRILWIDSICVDQSSASEKNHQLKLMDLVYSTARRVLMWLRNGSKNTKRIVRRM
ncbi:heterokaryon incompatibility, partial [Halenospora varia]